MYYDRPQKNKNKEKHISGIRQPARRKARPAGSARAVKKRAPVKRLKAKARAHNRPRSAKRVLRRLTIALAVLVLLALVPAGLYVLPLSALGTYTPSALGEEYTHILLIGTDLDSSGTSRSDTMMIASLGSDRICLTSLQRDTGVSIPGYTGMHRLNAAYAYGGTSLLLQTINLNFGLDISKYALVDYESFPALIDLMGGVYIEGVSNTEAEQINVNVHEILRRRYNSGELTYDQALALYRQEYLFAGGDLQLDGMQALGYARIRKTDSDYGRTNRQRRVVSAALENVNFRHPIRLIRLAAKGIGCIQTNLTRAQLLSLAEHALISGAVKHIDQTRLPVNGTYTDSGSMFYDVDYAANRRAFISFVYGK